MSTHKRVDRVCAAAAVLALLLTVLFVNGEALGVRRADRVMGYETRLFDTDRVHTIDIVMDDWEDFIETCENEEYRACSVVIDGEAYGNVGLRAKGNTSLSSVSRMDSKRYSFKIEFDQYESGKSYYGLDKLCLNNLIQDNTMMKDYLVYQMMNRMGVASPLCSFVYVTVNGQDWGMYLAVEAIEESFLERSYGSGYGELYKPDAMSMGAGRGNGRDFNMGNLDFDGDQGKGAQEGPERGERAGMEDVGPGTDGTLGDAPPPGAPPQGGIPEGMDGQMSMPEGMDGQMGRPEGADGRGGMAAMGSDDVKLRYIDDDPESYANIFESAKTDISDDDQARLIEALKKLSAGENLPEVVDIEAVIRYFAVHNFVVNGDSYTGSMIHNYYLYEEDGQLSMLPWDYNLAFGGFQTGDAAGAVNESIDRGAQLTDRPMIAWIFSDESYIQQYHQVLEELLTTVDMAGMIRETAERIAPYVERDPGKFCTYEEFETGVEALESFVALRSESVARQLSGNDEPIDTGDLDLSDMGNMGLGQPSSGEAEAAPGSTGETPGEGPSTEAAAEETPETGEPSGGNETGERQNRPFGSLDGGTPPGSGQETGSAGTAEGNRPLLLGISIGVMLAGLLAAAGYRKK